MSSGRNVVTLLSTAATALLLAAPGVAQERLPVVATFSILGDVVAQVGGERVTLTTLVGPDGDGHVYSPTPADARRVAEAEIVFVNGLEFEGWIDRLIASAGTDATIAVASEGASLLETDDGHGHEEDAHDHDHAHDDDHAHDHDHAHAHDHDDHAHDDHAHGFYDPHAWQDVENVVVYATNVRDALIAADPEGADTYRANAESYIAALRVLDEEIAAAVAAIPEERRTVVTSHDAFGYFEHAYGLEFVAPQGVSTEAEASARDVAMLITQIRETGADAVFVETITDERLMRRIAEETGAAIGGTLYSDALSPADGPAPTYIEMMRHNIRTLSEALGS
ncbi:metal ABC transporter solute-binding protein, Zn/Mn family [Salinarimonas ramus]|uniref:Metal ABC transporter substrate-binding protein n=1 Tax=Salinarimonas ramus TaxID=690164 RepID=A0A917QJS1_9HYPH|nr:zinc ABC transporter substrate-binding protein [Salinarimonas ramus]GGK53855.1 metal ABC transporter substrate-binding protein [Salinarimonas ramus]